MIHIDKLSVALGGRRILDAVDLDVAAGETVALVGPNGAGKTTILRCLLGLLRYQGRVAVGGLDVRTEPVRAKRLIGYMPQAGAAGEETALGSMALLAALRDVPRAAIAPLLERVGLAAHARRKVRTFSTGMRQRLALAAALLGDPPLLVLDEPTASLDLAGQREVIALLTELRAGGRTILLSSHRSEEVRALARRVVSMNEGRIVRAEPVAAAPHAALGLRGAA